jgi:hypothetical protein
MKSRFVAALAASVLALVLVAQTGHTVPAVLPYALGSPVTLHADTLARFSADSVTTTAAIELVSKRGVIITVKSSGTDTITCTVQTRIPGGNWIGTGGVKFVNGAITLPATGVQTTTFGNLLVSAFGTFDGTAGGTPMPLFADLRLRIKSADARRYDTANQATLAATGTITVVAYPIE